MKTIKSIIPFMILAVLITYTVPVMTQDKPDKEKMEKHRKEMAEKIKATKIAFITEHVALTPEEAEKFWPVYNEMEKLKEGFTHEIMERFRQHGEPKEMTDEEALEIMQTRLDQETGLLQIKVEYHEKFLDILSPGKVLKLYEAEDRFRRQLMERIKHRREGERKPQGRGTAPPHRGSRIHHR